MVEYVSQAKETSARHKRESLKALEQDERKEEEKKMEEILNSTLTA
jgi:hypothetical protein